MAIFDFSKAAKIISTSDNPILDVIGTQFGVPQCMMNISKAVLNALPTPILGNFGNSIREGKALADSVFKDITRQIFLDTGIVEYDTVTGKFVFVSVSSNKGVEENMLQGLNDLAGLGTILGFGARAWAIGEAAQDFLDELKSCIDKTKSFMALQKGPSGMANQMVGMPHFPAPLGPLDAASLVFDENKATLELAAGFVAQADAQLLKIQEIIQARQKGEPEPCFWGNLIDDNPDSSTSGQSLEYALSGLTSFCLVDAEADQDGNPIVSGVPLIDVVTLSGMQPPKSVKGQFLLSKTGIYYDVYGGGLDLPEGCLTNIVSAMYYDSSGGVIPGRGVPPNMLKWLYEYNPNLGGKGEIVNWATFNTWVNTVFDIDRINESSYINTYYDDDHFLQVLIDQRNREIYDLSSYIGDLTSSGYSEDSALLSNQRQVLYSKIARHDSKIKRRKKQIEVHVVLAPSEAPAVPGAIPINDFQGLDSYKLTVEKNKQERLLFNPGEVSGAVLPLCPTFIKSSVPQDTFTVEELMIPPVGVGSIITSDPPFTGTSGTVLSLDDRISTKGLVAIYNFLDSDLVSPDSDKYFVINCSTSSVSDKPAQLVASSIPSLFPSGIGIPYFRGICNMFSGVSGDGNPKASLNDSSEYLYSPYRPYGYARLQSGWNDIDSLLYNSSGATFEFWTHIPDLGTANSEGWNADGSLSALHRVVVGCENRGGSFSSTNGDWNIAARYGSDTVRGMIMGFTRDCRIVSGTAPSNNPTENDLTKGLVFHMSPTQSINSSGVTFFNASAECPLSGVAPGGYYGFKVDTSTATATGKTLNDCSTTFSLISLTVDHGLDKVTLYLNGESLASQTVGSTFGRLGPPNIPSMVDASSFSYDIQYKGVLPPNPPLYPPNSLGYRDFWYWDGPVPEGNPSVNITPWIIGGGYTDGMHTKNISQYVPGSNEGMNFMGGKWGGKKSGLYGFLGSLKLYNRAITAGEALQNYKAQQGFFETIRV